MVNPSSPSSASSESTQENEFSSTTSTPPSQLAQSLPTPPFQLAQSMPSSSEREPDEDDDLIANHKYVFLKPSQDTAIEAGRELGKRKEEEKLQVGCRRLVDLPDAEDHAADGDALAGSFESEISPQPPTQDSGRRSGAKAAKTRSTYREGMSGCSKNSVNPIDGSPLGFPSIPGYMPFRYTQFSQDLTTVDGNASSPPHSSDDSDGGFGDLTLAQLASRKPVPAHAKCSEEDTKPKAKDPVAKAKQDSFLECHDEFFEAELALEAEPEEEDDYQILWGLSLSTSEEEMCDSDESPPKPRYLGVTHPENWKRMKKRKEVSPLKGNATKCARNQADISGVGGSQSSESTGADSTIFPVLVSGRDESFPVVDSYENYLRFNSMLHPHAESFTNVPSNFAVRGIQSDQCPAVVPKEFNVLKKYPRKREFREFHQFRFLKEKYQQEFIKEVNRLLSAIPASFRKSQNESVRQWKDLTKRERNLLVKFETDFQCFCARYGYQVPVRLAVFRAFLYRLGNHKLTRRCTSYTNKIPSLVNLSKTNECLFPRTHP